jgi:RNA 2',3'-cyclic 3'-phosphodiesterase
MATIRSFIALPSSPELRKVLREIQTLLAEEGANVKWDTPDKFHITLKFLGDVDRDKLSTLNDLLLTRIAPVKTFQLEYNSIGAFPDLVHPKVIWAGAEIPEELKEFQERIELACEEFGIPKESRVFHPHITLGRVKGSTNLHRLTAKVKSITFEPLETSCSEVLLIKSELRPTGSVYTTLKSFPLNA